MEKPSRQETPDLRFKFQQHASVSPRAMARVIRCNTQKTEQHRCTLPTCLSYDDTALSMLGSTPVGCGGSSLLGKRTFLYSITVTMARHLGRCLRYPSPTDFNRSGHRSRQVVAELKLLLIFPFQADPPAQEQAHRSKTSCQLCNSCCRQSLGLVSSPSQMTRRSSQSC